MTKAELVDSVSKASDLTRKHSEVIVEAVFSSIVDALQRGDKIELRGFGSFRIRRRDSRTGRNPKTGAGVVVPAKRIPHFKPGKELRELINVKQGGAAPRSPEPPAARAEVNSARSAAVQLPGAKRPDPSRS
jgi:integration host factor subunit beta